MWPAARLFHRPDRTLCICSDRWSWSTSSRTKSQRFFCFEIHVRTLDNVKSKVSANIPNCKASSFIDFSIFLSSSMEIQNTPPSYSPLCFQANWAPKVVFPHPPRPQRAAICNSPKLWKVRHFSSVSIASSLPVNHLFCSGASKTTSLGPSESAIFSIFAFKISKSLLIISPFTSKILQRSSTCSCLISSCSSNILRRSLWSFSLKYISFLITSWMFLSSSQLDSRFEYCCFKTVIVLSNSDLNKARVEQILLTSSPSFLLWSSSESDSRWTSFRKTCRTVSSIVLPRHISSPV